MLSAVHHLLPGFVCSTKYPWSQSFIVRLWRRFMKILYPDSEGSFQFKSLVRINLERVGKSCCVKVFIGFKTWNLSLCRIWSWCCSPCTHQGPLCSSLTGQSLPWPTHLEGPQSIWDCQPLFKLETRWLAATEHWNGYGKIHILLSSLEKWPLRSVSFGTVLVLTECEERLFQ